DPLPAAALPDACAQRMGGGARGRADRALVGAAGGLGAACAAAAAAPIPFGAGNELAGYERACRYCLALFPRRPASRGASFPAPEIRSPSRCRAAYARAVLRPLTGGCCGTPSPAHPTDGRFLSPAPRQPLVGLCLDLPPRRRRARARAGGDLGRKPGRRARGIPLEHGPLGYASPVEPGAERARCRGGGGAGVAAGEGGAAPPARRAAAGAW